MAKACCCHSAAECSGLSTTQSFERTALLEATTPLKSQLEAAAKVTAKSRLRTRHKYARLKAQYLQSCTVLQRLTAKPPQCRHCLPLAASAQSTKAALAESLSLTALLLAELGRN